MCGRYAFTQDTEAARDHYRLAGPVPRLDPQPEIFPTQPVPVVALKSDGSRLLALVRWGIPVHWQKQPLINARSEGAAFKPTFRGMFSKQRCLLPATSFFEWKAEGRKKVRHRITFPGRPLVSFAGLWDAAAGTPGVVILTTAANEAVAAVHDRMPVVVWPDDYARWLDWDTPTPDLLGLMRAAPAGETTVERDEAEKLQPALF